MWGRDDDIAIDEPVELAGHAWLQIVVLAVFYEGAEEEDGVLLFSSAAQLRRNPRPRLALHRN